MQAAHVHVTSNRTSTVFVQLSLNSTLFYTFLHHSLSHTY
jgi:hypothetical protein